MDALSHVTLTAQHNAGKHRRQPVAECPACLPDELEAAQLERQLGQEKHQAAARASLDRLRTELAAGADAPAEPWYAATVRNLTSQGWSPAEVVDYLERTTTRGQFGSGPPFTGLHLREVREVRELAEALDAGSSGALPGWRDVERWAVADFERHVRLDIEGGRNGSYRSVAERTEGWSATALLRRWQKVSGRKPWPSPAANRTTSHHR